MKMIYICLLTIGFSGAGIGETRQLKPGPIVISDQTDMVVTRPPNRRIKTVAVIVHGLNLNPERMDDWTKFLSNKGALVLRLALHGHRGNIDEMRNVQVETWRHQIDKALNLARTLGQKHRIPVVYLGYSLGGLLGVDWLARQKNDGWVFHKMVLLAPAIATPWYSQLAEKMLARLDGSWVFPTPNIPEFRANWGSSINAYRALFTLKAFVEAQGYHNANVDTLVMLDRNDELIPFRDIKDIISKHQLSKWKLEAINNDFAKQNHGFRHLIANQNSVGPGVWQELSQKIAAHLNLR